MHKFKFVVHQGPDPEVFIKCFFGTDSKGLAQKIIRGEIELPKKPDAKGDKGAAILYQPIPRR